ncbi:putative reverse transcriptase zinc-binding domain-containing protein [Helianthus annuus]|uniref:Reverse transcriptase zinc-binding domain-containing protein n=1 Tax=Helianthus annuus TaxID=4232 RepID=A0A9K3NMS0_HELAN|nr:putative reverse transcriptase zinc-binding domain-containing protein [Helianthus annuus]KAJ0918061.1 putative reverse transcriptase zinc-binding domain-containing protein [Helianthus annuus]KAJ0921834.1 putative reverse transcriptase zinc-binding domain-containing protein [Helianthus annuus]
MKWCSWVPLKCNILAWRAEMGKIAIALELRKGIQVENTTRTLCNFGEEDTDHLFTSYEVALVLWQHISNWCRVLNIFAFTFSDLLELHNVMRISDRAKEVFGSVARYYHYRLLEHLEGKKRVKIL